MTVLYNDDQWDRSNVLFDNGRIMRYDKRCRTPDMRHIDYGLGVLQAQALRAYPAGQTLDLATVYQDLQSQKQLAGFEVMRRFYEIGSPEGLEETRQYLEQKG
jgi:NDP-sugar pyrophosphorylase family protein